MARMKSIHCALFLGLALASGALAAEPSSDASPALDVVFALDTSTNALAATGADVNGDGRAASQRYFLGFIPIRPDRADSVLAAELKAVATALDRLDARTTRVGVVGYAGDAADGKRGAELIAPLTENYADVRAALQKLARRGPKGMTDLSGGIDLAAVQFGPPAVEPAVAGGRRVLVLLSDGRATLPYRGEPVTNRSESVAAAQRAARSDVRVLVYGVGPDLSEDVLRQIAEAAKGEYTRVANPAEIDISAALLGSLPEPEPEAP